ncbi:MAG: hypothetical protein M1816_004073 [Peltula sp. TS41687]|nr:MAG: hypothetical protein M1816_004073 [Peltula sp. TS41687]
MSPSAIVSGGGMNGYANGHEEKRERHASQNRSCIPSTDPDVLHDLICVGFGPASLAIATALHDALSSSSLSQKSTRVCGATPKVAFLERQPHFAWHDGMLLPDAKMQISFMKDLATLRDPRSEFTFINYLHRQNRLVQFINLGTFLPFRTEYNAYMHWCADWFRHVVHYGQNVHGVVPDEPRAIGGKVDFFRITSTDLETGEIRRWRARHVVIAAGGEPKIPAVLSHKHPRIIHSSSYLKSLPYLLPDKNAHYNVAIIGSGQSAAEIFDDLQSKYPNSSTSLIIKGAALKPSDDSPFVNEAFDPCRVDEMFQAPSSFRAASIANDRNTNYGVVRLELLERLYEKMYQQRLSHPDERNWDHRILPYRMVAGAEDVPGAKRMRLILQDCSGRYLDHEQKEYETIMVDAVVLATGYVRNAHEGMLHSARHLMSGGDAPNKDWKVGRDYRVQMDPRKVSSSAGVWLQGCNENTHGLSDTLLSVLAVRGGEIVESIFGQSITKHDDCINGFVDNDH